MTKRSVLVSVILVSAFCLVGASMAAATPKVGWSQSTIATTVTPGQQGTANVTFTTTKDMVNITFRLDPSVAGIVKVDPTSFASVTKGAANSITLTINMPANAKRKSYNGNLWAQADSKKCASPLHLRFTAGQ